MSCLRGVPLTRVHPLDRLPVPMPRERVHAGRDQRDNPAAPLGLTVLDHPGRAFHAAPELPHHPELRAGEP